MQSALPTSAPEDRFSMQNVIKTFNASSKPVGGTTVVVVVNPPVVPTPIVKPTTKEYNLVLWYNVGDDAHVTNSFDQSSDVMYESVGTPLFSAFDRSPVNDSGIVNESYVLKDTDPFVIPGAGNVSINLKTRLEGSEKTIMYQNGKDHGTIILNMAGTGSAEQLDDDQIGNGTWVTFNTVTNFSKTPSTGATPIDTVFPIALTTGIFKNVTDLKVKIENLDTHHYWRQITIIGKVPI
jgi:hypothetical protein